MESPEAEPTGKSCNQETRVLSMSQKTEELESWKLNERQQQIVDASRLGNLIHTAGLPIDRYVLMAFCELWNKETNTAQFHGFEMAPSLRDTAYILGIPVIGRVVTTGSVLNESMEDLCFQYLRRVPDCRHCRGSHVKLSWLQSEFSQLSEHPTDDEITYSTRAYLLFLIGSTLFPEKDRGYVSTKYLALLSDLEKVGEYAWGAAALAHLYKGLSTAVMPCARRRLFGSATLLMGWICEYIPAMRSEMEDAPAHIFPRTCRWMGSKISQPTKEVSDIKRAFSLLQVSDVDWEPYRGMDPASIPRHCVAPDNICFSRAWLISFNLKEIYAPDRFARQFGQEQHHPLNDVPAFQRHQWNPLVDWTIVYAAEIKQLEKLINAAAHCDPTDEAPASTDSAADVFTPETIARASLGLSMVAMVEKIREELPTIARFLDQRPLSPLPDEVARSLARIRELVESPPPPPPPRAPKERGAARREWSPQPEPEPIAVLPPVLPERVRATDGSGMPLVLVGCPEEAEAEAEEEPVPAGQAQATPGGSAMSEEEEQKGRRRRREAEEGGRGRGVRRRRSSRRCVQAKRFKHREGKGSHWSDPIVL